MRVASFFSGIGGIDLGLERAGMSSVFMCEINPFCRSILSSRWPNVPLVGDVNEVLPEQIPEADLWCGGFPCQDLSLANQGKRKGLAGERSGLFVRFAELLNAGRPNWVLIENVPGLLNSNNGEDFEYVLSTLDELGYGLSWRVFDAKFFGTPQRRRRVYIVGSYRSFLAHNVLFEHGSTEVPFAQGFLAEQNSPTQDEGSNRESDIYVIQHAGIGRRPSAGPQAKGYRNDGEAYTLDSRGSADAICSTLTPFRVRAIAGVTQRLDGNRYRSIGNSVAVPVIEWIGRRIIEYNRLLNDT